MAEMEQEEFQFPDEVEAKGKPEVDFEIEIEDDTPPEDRNKAPMPKEVVEKLDSDELDKYEGETKEKFKQLKKVWHDERREKEQAAREREEALALARKAIEENKKLKEKLSSGEQVLVDSHKAAAQSEMDLAKKEYREAYDSGDADKLIEAQEKLTAAKIKADRLANYEPPAQKALQEEEFVVQREQPVRVEPDRRAQSWQSKNQWFGQDEEMTSLALGLHEKLKRNGVHIGSDEYYESIDKTMRKRFPEAFEEEQKEVAVPAEQDDRQKTSKPKASTVVAPATRSTSPKKVRLTNTQVLIAKKLGLTPEQYVREQLKLEAQNG
ncbi:hypothetical protein [Flavobacterium sp.]|jgi:hypothetical protein|uniref:hypothetical protein n=1 Tax=Flavobacterium sp. TaxID=239 RepID=UPI0037BFF1A1